VGTHRIRSNRKQKSQRKRETDTTTQDPRKSNKIDQQLHMTSHAQRMTVSNIRGRRRRKLGPSECVQCMKWVWLWNMHTYQNWMTYKAIEHCWLSCTLKYQIAMPKNSAAGLETVWATWEEERKKESTGLHFLFAHSLAAYGNSAAWNSATIFPIWASQMTDSIF